MKRTAGFALLALVSPFCAFAHFPDHSPFERHFGTYDVLSTSEVNGGDCPLQVATISPEWQGGAEAIAFEAFGDADDGEGSDCRAHRKTTLSMRGGRFGDACYTSEDLIDCRVGGEGFRVSARETEEGNLVLNLASFGSDPWNQIWILRRRWR